MNELKKQPAWCQHPVILGLACGIASFFAATIFIATIPPAWAVSVPIGNLFVIDLGDLPPWIAAAVLAMTWWEARKAKQISKANSADIGRVKDDVKLIERNTNSMTKTIEQLAQERGVEQGLKSGKQAGEATAATLAEGQRQGAASERASVAAANPVPPAAEPAVEGKKPLLVADERTAGAAERSATALERTAVATEEKK